MKTILFDVDGVLADFVYAFTRECGIEPYSTPLLQVWDFGDTISKSVQSKAWEKIIKTPMWWADYVPTLASLQEFGRIDDLTLDNQVVFCTNRTGTPSPQRQTEAWLIMQGNILNPHVIVSKRKGDVAKAIDADYAIDDTAENAACVHWIADSKPCKSYILDRPYNRTKFLPTKVRRVFSVAEFLEDVKTGV